MIWYVLKSKDGEYFQGCVYAGVEEAEEKKIGTTYNVKSILEAHRFMTERQAECRKQELKDDFDKDYTKAMVRLQEFEI